MSPRNETSGHPKDRGGGPMHATIRLGRFAGVEIGINWSWLVVFALIGWSVGAVVFPETSPGLSDATYVAMALIATPLFFASLLLHELAHAVVARREGMEIDGIVLWLFGGVAQFKGLFPSAGAELRIAIAGPVVTLIIAGASLGLAGLGALPASVEAVVGWLGSVNLLLLVFNMLPALPLDGGRVLRALIWQRTGDFTKATRIAGGLGQAFGRALIGGGLLLALLFLYPGGLWLALIGWFLSAAASAERRFATISAALKPLRVADAMANRPITADADSTLAQFIEGPFAGSRHAAYPTLAGGRVTGLLSFREMAAMPPDRWDDLHVRDVARAIDRVVVLDAGDDLGEAAMKLTQDDLGRGLVLDADDRLVGLLSMTDVARLIELRTGSGGRRPQPAGQMTARPSSVPARSRL